MPRADGAQDAGRLQHETPDRPIGRVLRPGVEMPDWSAVTSETSRRALEASFAVAGRHEKWAGLGDEEDQRPSGPRSTGSACGISSCAPRIPER